MTQAFPLQWPSGWSRTQRPTRAKFHKKVTNSRGWSESASLTIPDAVKRLFGELDRLGARYVTISSNAGLRQDGLPRAGRKEPDDTGVAVYFTLNGKEMALACDTWDRVADNIVAVAKHIEALRGMERWGVGTASQAFAGYRRLEAPKPSCWSILGLSPSASAEQINAAYRKAARGAHPDNGGSHERMAALNSAREQALREVGQ